MNLFLLLLFLSFSQVNSQPVLFSLPRRNLQSKPTCDYFGKQFDCFQIVFDESVLDSNEILIPSVSSIETMIMNKTNHDNDYFYSFQNENINNAGLL